MLLSNTAPGRDVPRFLQTPLALNREPREHQFSHVILRPFVHVHDIHYALGRLVKLCHGIQSSVQKTELRVCRPRRFPQRLDFIPVGRVTGQQR